MYAAALHHCKIPYSVTQFHGSSKVPWTLTVEHQQNLIHSTDFQVRLLKYAYSQKLARPPARKIKLSSTKVVIYII